MAYIGNEPTSIAFLTDTFNGTGSQTAYTLSAAPASTSSILVAVSGVLQDPATYGVTGLTLNFSAAPPSGTGNISVRYLGIPASGVTTTAYRTVTEFTATASQTTFTPPSYTVGFINVYRNGVLLGSADYTATNGTTVVLAVGATSGDLVTVESFQVSSVVNAIQNTSGSVSATNLAAGAALSNIGTGGVTASYLASGAALSNLGTAQLADANMAPGSIIQVVYGETSDRTSFSGITSWTDTGMTATITPSSTSSRILVLVDGKFGGTTTGINFTLRLLRNGTLIYGGTDTANKQGFAHFEQGWAAFQYFIMPGNASTVDSPASTSALTYKVQLLPNGTGSTIYMNRTDNNSSAQGNTRSSITLLEIAG
jgi:hypothetical protein